MCYNLLNYLRRDGLNALVSELGIDIRRHKDFNNLVQFKYNQINSPPAHLVVRECRGIILDEANDWNVVSYPYNRFYNHDDPNAPELDWNTVRVQEKLDGSLMVVYFYNNQWMVSSSGLPDASGEVFGTSMTFGDLFWKIWNDSGYNLPKDNGNCYMFEMCSAYNKVIVKHEKPRIVLHGARRLSDFRELDPYVVSYLNGWECVKYFPLRSWNEIITAADQLDPMKEEGFVVVDGGFNRVKVKSPKYVAVAHLKEGFSVRRALEIIRTNEQNEFIAYFPEYKNVFEEIKQKYEWQVGFIEGFYEAIKGIDDRKQFAIKAKDQKFSGILFNLKFGKLENVRAGLANMNIKVLEDWLDIKLVL